MYRFCLSLICICFHALLFGQANLSGEIKIEDALIAGVAVQEEFGQTGTYTDNSGKFNLRVDNTPTNILISYVGYDPIRLTITRDTFISLNLKESTLNLSEVVVTALGLERSSKDLGYSVQRLNSSVVSSVKSPNFIDNLAAKLAGVTISQGATGVGSTSKIIIRGEPSFTNNNPLFIIDGIIINNRSSINLTDDAAAGFQEVDFGNGAMEVSADDIESVDVLKGPGAAALYGSRASNGVIIITTKGSTKEGLGITLNTSNFWERPFQLPKFQNKYGQGNSGKFEFVDGLGGGINDNITYSWGPALDQGILIPQFDSPVTLSNGSIVRGGDVRVHGGLPINPTPFKSYPDNLRSFYETGITNINNIAFSSGFEKGGYRLSLTDLRSKSTIPGVNLSRQNLLGKFSFNPMKALEINANINYVHSESDNRPANGYGSENINYSLVAWGPRSLNIDALKDYWQPGLEGIQQYSFNYTFFDNPYFILKENKNGFGRDRLFGNITVAYEIFPNLQVRFRSGMDYSKELRTFKRAYSSNRFRNGAYAEQDISYRELNTEILLNYSTGQRFLSTEISLGANRMNRSTENNQIQALSLAQPGIYRLTNAASPLEAFQFNTRKRINSVFGLFKFGFQNIIFLDITGRNDWSSALATPTSNNSSSFFYPSASLSFVGSNAFHLPEEISFLKFRASWAQVGNDTEPYQTSATFLAQTPYGGLPTFSAGNSLANETLVPEKTISSEFGIDIRFLDDRVKLDLAYYNAITKNQIISLPIPISSGYTNQIVNGGAVRSKGMEIILGLKPIIQTNFTWQTMLNFSTNVTTVEELPQNVDRLTLAYSRVYDNVNQTVWFQVEEGGKIGDMYGTGYLKNEKGDFILDEGGNFIVDNNLILLGNYNPDFILGSSNNLRYKNWHVDFVLDWRQGGELVSRTQALAGVGGQLLETIERPEEGIVAAGVINQGTAGQPIYRTNEQPIPAESYYRQYYDRNHEENNTYDASYMKLRSFSIGYHFDTKNSRLLDGVQGLHVALIGRNIFALSKIPHFDPEQLAVQGSQFISGVEDMSYPTSRSIGIKLGFEF